MATAQRAAYRGYRKDGNMQEYTSPLSQADAVNTYLGKMEKNIQSVASQFSGNAFPTTDLKVGMLCMRTDDDNNIYKLTNLSPLTWELLPSKEYVDNNISTSVKSIQKFQGATATKAGTTGLVPAPAKGMQDDYYLGADGTWKKVTQRSVKQVVDMVYPVGSIFQTTTNDDPNSLWTGTTWIKMSGGRVLVSAGTYADDSGSYTYDNGSTGGTAKEKLTTNEMPSHGHSASVSTASLTGGMNARAGEEYGLNGCATDSWGIVSSWNETGRRRTGGEGCNYPLNMKVDASHSHSVTVNNTGGNQYHENRQPFLVVNMWKRTA